MIEAHIPSQLMEELEKKWPDRCPDPNWDDRTIWMCVGARALVDTIKTSYNAQQKKAAEKIL